MSLKQEALVEVSRNAHFPRHNRDDSLKMVEGMKEEKGEGGKEKGQTYNYKNSSLKGLERLDECSERLSVEIVGGLIQQHDVGATPGCCVQKSANLE